MRKAISQQLYHENEFDTVPSPNSKGSVRSLSRHTSVQNSTVQSPRPDTSYVHDYGGKLHVHSSIRRPETSPNITDMSNQLLMNSRRSPLINSSEFSPAEWNITNINSYKKADVIRQKAEAVRSKANQLIEEHADYTRKGGEQARYRLGERMKDVIFWRGELQQEISVLRSMTETLSESRRNVDHALAQSERPLRVYTKCKELREKRLGIELVKDSVELSLQTELEIIKHHQDVFKQILKECTDQIEKNTDMVQRLTSDLNNKEQAISIDQATVDLAITAKGPTPALSNRNKDQGFKGRGPNGKKEIKSEQRTEVPNRKIQQWSKNSQQSLQISLNLRSETSKLTAKAESACAQAIAEIKSAWEGTNLSLVSRAKELEDTHKRIQGHLDNTVQEIKDQEIHLEQLKSSIKSKQNPLTLAKARLAMRARLPEEEACMDTPYIALLEEVGQLQESMDTLGVALEYGQSSLKELLEVKLSLEHDLFLKTNSISIDRKQCLPLRAEFPFHLWCGCSKCKSCRTSLYCRTHVCKKV
ncbi:tektin-4 [Eurytemora carolleeae]|uniref:tektin-4 n=1 Tax=Eurytemora carolleeae TaxID=1294199 RepID=UPI000C75CB76|nr:tektin-4 [Eurytemora carolleeae]|eukprot:XP_023330307.1 tektin-4-like [Eurytemora affinis]